MNAVDMPLIETGSPAHRPASSEAHCWASDTFFVDAANLRWRVSSAGSGGPVLFIHGTGSSLETWRDVLPALASHYRVISIDLPGHGQTQPLPLREVSLPAMVAGTVACLEQLDTRPVALVGHSAGAAIALRMVLDSDLKPASVIALNPALWPFGGHGNLVFGPMARLCAALPMLPRVIARRASDARAVQRMIAGTGSTLSQDGIAMYQKLFTDERHVRSTMAMMANWDLSGLVSAIEPIADRTHFIVGERDSAVSPASVYEVQRRHPAIAISRMPSAGHLAHEERPLEAAAIIGSILARPGGK